MHRISYHNITLGSILLYNIEKGFQSKPKAQDVVKDHLVIHFQGLLAGRDMQKSRTGIFRRTKVDKARELLTIVSKQIFLNLFFHV